MINLQTLIAYCRIKYPNMEDYDIERTLIYCHIHHIFTYGYPLFNESIYGSFNLRGYYQDLRFIYLDEKNQDNLKCAVEYQAEYYKYETKSLAILDFNKHYENACYNYNCDSESNLNKTLEYLTDELSQFVVDFLEFEHSCKYEESIVNKYDDIFDKIKHKIKPNQTINILELVKLFDIKPDTYNLLVLNIENSYCEDKTNNHYDNKYSMFDYQQFEVNDDKYCMIRIGEQILVQHKEGKYRDRFYLVTYFENNPDIFDLLIQDFKSNKYINTVFSRGENYDIDNDTSMFEFELNTINLFNYSHYNQKQFILDLNTYITKWVSNPEWFELFNPNESEEEDDYSGSKYRDLKNIQSNLINHLVNFL